MTTENKPENNGAEEQKPSKEAAQETPSSKDKEEQKVASTEPQSEANPAKPVTTPTPEMPEVPPVPQVKTEPDPSEQVMALTEKVRNELHKAIIGQDEVIELLMAGLFCHGHILLEGVPGVAKTTLVKLLSKTLSAEFQRIQFTPDLMPSDVLGTSVYNMQTSTFDFKKGPVFSNFILIDEINRSPAKTQAALFETMEERQVTIDGTTYPMGFPFVIVATQNPIEHEGTYQLPEGQLDRFLFKLKVDYPDLDHEKQILERFESDFEGQTIEEVQPVFGPKELKECMAVVEKIHINKGLLGYIAEIIHSSRNNADLFLGASPRASLAMVKAAKAMAAIRGRNFVTPDDIKDVSYAVLNHRVILSPEREMDGVALSEVLDDIISKVEVPR